MNLIIGVMGLGGKATSNGIHKGVERLSKKYGWTGQTYTHIARVGPADLIRKHQGERIILVGNSLGVDAIDDILEANPDLQVDTVFAVVSAMRETFPSNVKEVVRVIASNDRLRNFELKHPNIRTIEIDASHVAADDSEKLWQEVEKYMNMQNIIAAHNGIKWTGNAFNRTKFFDAIRPVFGSSLNQSQVEGMESLLAHWEEYCIQWDMRELAYNLGTAFHETAKTMQPINERGSREYFLRYEGRPDLGNTQAGDGFRYRGAGHVQNTGRRNAGKATEELNRQFGLNVDLVANPDERLQPKISALSLYLGNHQGWWTGQRLPNFAGYGNWDMQGARTVVNGSDRWQLIGGYAGEFLDALKASAETPAYQVPSAPEPVTSDLEQYLEMNFPNQTDAARNLAAMIAVAIRYEQEVPTIQITNQPKEIHMLQGQKKAFRSKTIIGIAAAAVSIFVPQLAPIVDIFVPAANDITPEAADATRQAIETIVVSLSNIMTAAGLLFAGYGRVAAKEQVKL